MSQDNAIKNRGTHGDSSFMLGGMPSSSENRPAQMAGNVNEIRSVSEAFLSHLSEEDGLFIVTQYGNGESYIAINNLDGRGWIERFQNRTTAIYWLLGHTCLNIKNELCDGTTGQKILDIADRVRRGDRWR